MDADDLKRIASGLFGRGWQTRLSEALEIDGSTVRRYVSAGLPVPNTLAAFLRMMCGRQAARGELVYERQRLGRPLHILTGTPHGEDLPNLAKHVAFPGVAHPKRMPAIVSRREGALLLSLTSGRNDAIDETAASYVLTRHPDPWHRDAYLAAAARAGHEAAAIHHRWHHYTLIAHEGAACVLTHQIATHLGAVRTVVSSPAAPSEILSSSFEPPSEDRF